MLAHELLKALLGTPTRHSPRSPITGPYRASPRPAVATISRWTSFTPPPNVLICAWRALCSSRPAIDRARRTRGEVAGRPDDPEQAPVDLDRALGAEDLHRGRRRGW